MIKEHIKTLWTQCFTDSEAFTDLYFRLRYRDDRNLALWEDQQPVAALQILPYPMIFHGESLPTGYISGACTHPDYRNRGLMGQLLKQAFHKMGQEGNALTTLIPAEPWLFDYYARFGYAPVFHQTETIFENQPVTVNPDTTDEILEVSDTYSEEVACFLEEQYRRQYTCCLLHPAADLQVVFAALQLDQGRCFALRQYGQLQAVALAIPLEGTWRIEELLAVDERSKNSLLQRMSHALHPSPFTLLASFSTTHDERLKPLGMARILQASRVLALHAQAHPELTLHLSLQDEQLPANNGYYHLQHGTCTFSPQPDAANYRHYTISELTEALLLPEHPHMSLMLN